MANRRDDKVVVVTGAARGLGLATAATSIGGKAVGIVADISNADEIRAATDQVVALRARRDLHRHSHLRRVCSDSW